MPHYVCLGIYVVYIQKYNLANVLLLPMFECHRVWNGKGPVSKKCPLRSGWQQVRLSKKKKGPGVEVIRQLLHKNHQTQTELVVHM